MAHLLARSFIDDPYPVALLGRGPGTMEQLERLLKLQLETSHLRQGLVDVALDGDQLAGAAVWLAPHHDQGSALTRLRSVPAYLRILGPRIGKAALLELQSIRSHPRFAHWYLYLLGVNPAQRGRGVGGRLLEHRLDRLPQDDPVYLEATTTGSARLYAWHGFVELGPVPLGRRAEMIGMWRPAAASRG